MKVSQGLAKLPFQQTQSSRVARLGQYRRISRNKLCNIYVDFAQQSPQDQISDKSAYLFFVGGGKLATLDQLGNVA